MWSFFDAIYCINLEKEKARKENVQTIFSDWNIPVTFFKAIEDSNGNRGCLLSHKAIYNLALNSGFQRIIIFEDDIIATEELNSPKLESYVKFMENEDWDIFYLGAVPAIFSHAQKKITENIYKIRGICTHAYALNKTALERYKNIEYTPEAPLDYIIKNDHKVKSFAAYPSLFYQETGYNFPQKMIVLALRLNEAYAYFIGFPVRIVLIFLIIFLIIFWILKKRKKIKTNG